MRLSQLIPSRRHLLAGLTALVAAGCSQEEPLTAPPEARRQPVPTVALEVSSLTAAPGNRVAVAISARLPGERALGALQGVLRYDARSLRYLGQAPATDAVSLVHAEPAGRLAVASYMVGGLPTRTVTLAFEVLRAGYTDRLDYLVEVAATPTQDQIFYRATGGRVIEAGDLSVPAAVAIMGLEDWARLVAPEELAAAGAQLVPGDLSIPALKYGNANLDAGNAVNTLDALYVAQVAAGVNPLISATNSPNRDAVVAGNVRPAGTTADNVGIETAGANAGKRVVNVLDALAIANYAAGIPEAIVGTVIPGRGVAITDTITLSCPILASRTLFADTIYKLPRVTNQADVCLVGTAGAGTAVVLTLQAGTKLLADAPVTPSTANGYGNTLVIGRNAQIIADGTFLKPIEFSCVVEGGGAVYHGCWGGLYVNGNAPVNNGSATSPAIAGRQSGGALEAIGEGNTGLYGGDNESDNSGTLRYVRIQGAGTIFSGTSERNGLTLHAVGRGTTVEYIHVDKGRDDGIEWFGGTVNVRYALVTDSWDDGLDWVAGWRGKLQFGLVVGCNTGCDNGIEADNFGTDNQPTMDVEAAPRSAPTLYNITLLGGAAPKVGGHGMIFRVNTGGFIRNAAVLGWDRGFDLDGNPANPINAALFSVCEVIGRDSLSLTHSFFAASVTANGDPDGSDPNDASGTTGGAGVCGFTGTAGSGYNHNGSDLEALYLADAARSIAQAAGSVTTHLIDPYGFVPDYRIRPGSALATTVGATPPNDGFFDVTATYIGAAGVVGSSAVVPWWSGWTFPTRP